MGPSMGHGGQRRKKSLLIGINYTGSQHALHGCHNDVENVRKFLQYQGYPSDPHSQVILRDDKQGPFYPSGQNILSAMDWLVHEPGTCNFLHYSGHGGQVPDPDGDRASGFDDTIVPVDYERNGQITSDTLHKHLVSRLPPNSTLFIIFDCCHSGSAVELPWVYRTDEYGNVSMMDNVKAGMQLMGRAEHLIQGGFTFQKIGEAKQLLGGATDFFQGLRHQFGGGGQDGRDAGQDDGLSHEQFAEDWSRENKTVTMFSGCRDDQTSADANIQGVGEGAMSWAFLQVMQHTQGASYLQTLQETRRVLKQSNYSQIPQLSCGVKMDLNQRLIL